MCALPELAFAMLLPAPLPRAIRYLDKLQTSCAPLYKLNLDAIEDALPAIMHAIGNIHSISRYYNTNERMTALFIKVTNQLIKLCREYEKKRAARYKERGGFFFLGFGVLSAHTMHPHGACV